MIGKDIYKIYTPYGAKWTEWIRPVAFVAIDTYNRSPLSNWIERKNIIINNYDKNTAFFIDLPGKESIEYAISLAHLGYRPIPLFNGTDNQELSNSTTNNELIESCLINGSFKLKNINLSQDANPAFLLDSYRTTRFRTSESIYDNSWDLYAQDIPTIEYFKSNNITTFIIISQSVQKDLRKIFFKFQDAGINFFLSDGYTFIKKIRLNKTLREKLEKEEL